MDMRGPPLMADELALDAPGLEAADDWAEAQDDECGRLIDWPCRPGVDRCRAYLRLAASDGVPGTLVWFIRSPAGFAGGIDLPLHEDAWNVSCFVHPAHCGRGIATRSLRRVCEWALCGLRA